MVNRIFKWWNEVIAWKERFEKLFPASFLQSKDFQRAELKKMEKILSYPTGKFNDDEKLSRKYLKQEYLKLNRKIYPNPFIRFSVNAAKASSAMLRWSINKIKKPPLPRDKDTKANDKAVLSSDSEIKEFLTNAIAESKAKINAGKSLNNEIPATGNLSNEKGHKKVVVVRRTPSVQKNGHRRKR